jgi:peptide-methionine (S)-S-oxide reductase
LGRTRILKHLPVPKPAELMAVRNPLKQTDGYAECVKTTFDSKVVSIEDLIHRFNEIIDP